jgi:hypothetical protein
MSMVFTILTQTDEQVLGSRSKRPTDRPNRGKRRPSAGTSPSNEPKKTSPDHLPHEARGFRFGQGPPGISKAQGAGLPFPSFSLLTRPQSLPGCRFSLVGGSMGALSSHRVVPALARLLVLPSDLVRPGSMPLGFAIRARGLCGVGFVAGGDELFFEPFDGTAGLFDFF